MFQAGRSVRRALSGVLTLVAGAGVMGATTALLAFGALGVAAAVQEPAPIVVTGPVSRLVLQVAEDGTAPGGIIEVGNLTIAIPPGLVVELPGTTLTLPAVFALAPAACREANESGLARADRCRVDPAGAGPPDTFVDTTPRSGLAPKPDFQAPVALAQVSARREPGGITALAVTLTKNLEQVWGAVSYVNAAQGYVRVSGPLRQDEGGMLVRFNDPEGRQAVQSGVACGSEGNCSPDARFRMDWAQVSIRFRRGNPACVPSDSVPGFCPDANRPLTGDTLLDPVPIKVGDHVKAMGAFEVAGGVRFFSAQKLVVEADPRRR